jgi:hypothetical protein
LSRSTVMTLCDPCPVIISCVPLQVKNAVITVPAYFNDAQRQATKVQSDKL